jgi:hypothetical protein
MRRRRRKKRRRISIASLKIFEEETSSSSSEEEEEGAFLESGFEVSLGVCVFSKSSSSSRDDVDDAFVTDRTGTPSSSSVEEDEDEKEEEEEFVVRLSYAFDISNALVRSRLGTMMITNDKSENNNKDKDKEVLKTMVFTLKEERFSSSSNEQKGNVSTHITLSVDAHEMQKILERVPLRVKENTACVFVETMKREDDNSKKYIVDDRLTVVAKHFRCEETGKLKRQFVNPFVWDDDDDERE